MFSDLVLAAREGNSLVVQLNRPDAGNAISLEVAQALAAIVQSCAADASLRALIITGAGDKFFCTGGDVKAYAHVDSADELNRQFNLIRELLDAIENLRCPVIAAINGYAIGGGAELALACDLRIMEASAQMGFPQSRLGILPGWDGIERLVPLVGRAAATRLLLTGLRMSAIDARAIGLVDEVANDGQSIAKALELVRTFSEVAPLSITAIKSALGDVSRSDRHTARTNARDVFARLWFTDDHREAERAFAEKRPARFAGR